MGHFHLEGLLGPDNFFSEFHLLTPHILLDISLTVSESFLYHLVDSLLNFVVLLGDNAQQLTVEHLEFVVEVVNLVLHLTCQTLQTLGSLHTGRLETGSVGLLAGNCYSCGEESGLDSLIGIIVFGVSFVGRTGDSSLDVGSSNGSSNLVVSSVIVAVSCVGVVVDSWHVGGVQVGLDATLVAIGLVGGVADSVVVVVGDGCSGVV